MTQTVDKLPKEWKQVTLESICKFSNGLWTGKSGTLQLVKVIRNTNFTKHGLLDYSDVAEIEVEVRQLEHKVLSDGDILLERSGGGPTQAVGRVAFFDREGSYSFSNFITRIEITDRSQLNSKYLWYALHNFYTSGITENLQRRTHGIRNLEFNKYKKLLIPLPPLAEQERIVKILNEQLEAVETARKAAEEQLRTAQALPAAYLRDVFESEEAKKWKTVKFEEVAEIIMGQSPKGASCNTNKTGFPLLNGPTEFGELSPTAVQWTIEPTRFSKKDDILFCVRGNTTGRMNLSNQEYCIGRGLAAIRGKEELLNTLFLQFLLEHITQMLLKQTSGSTFPNLTGNSLRNFIILIPILKEQEKIAYKLKDTRDSIKDLIVTQKNQLEEINALPATLLKKAFQGEL